MDQFDIPIVLFMFKRTETTLRVVDRISKIKPRKIYLLADEGRNETEKKMVHDCRNAVENSINWNCEIIKNYANENRGVYENIALGAKWVFEKESSAIFLEDDNLPELSFFQYCKELLTKYENDTRILWICGTNYLGEYSGNDEASYLFTKHLLPCGWASWSDKFLTYYDFNLNSLREYDIYNRLRLTYNNTRLYNQQIDSIRKELSRKNRGLRYHSWDYHMALSVRSNNLFGISPIVNQIKNIGVDEHSEHGGTSFNNVMTKRLCGMDSYTLDFPLKHPINVLQDFEYEKKISKILLIPLFWRLGSKLKRIVRKIINDDPYEKIDLRSYFRKKDK